MCFQWLGKAETDYFDSRKKREEPAEVVLTEDDMQAEEVEESKEQKVSRPT